MPYIYGSILKYTEYTGVLWCSGGVVRLCAVRISSYFFPSVQGLAMGLNDGSLANRPGCITTSGRNITILEIANNICRQPKVGKEGTEENLPASNGRTAHL